MRTHNIYQDTEAARLNAIQCLKEDKSSHVACEVLISSNNLVIAGEIMILQ